MPDRRYFPRLSLTASPRRGSSFALISHPERSLYLISELALPHQPPNHLNRLLHPLPDHLV